MNPRPPMNARHPKEPGLRRSAPSQRHSGRIPLGAAGRPVVCPVVGLVVGVVVRLETHPRTHHRLAATVQASDRTTGASAAPNALRGQQSEGGSDGYR